MIEFKEEHQGELRKFSSVPIQTEVFNITSEHPYSADHFEIKFQDNISPYEQNIEKQEEKLTPLTKSDREKLHSDFDKYFSEMKATNEHITAMITKLHDKYDKNI